MIIVRNTTSTNISAGTTIVPFTTLVADTNDTMDWNSTNNSVVMEKAGRYNTCCTVAFSGTTEGSVSIQLMANGVAMNGLFSEATIPAAGEQTLVLRTPITVSATNTSDAYLQWAITSENAVVMMTAFADVQRIQ